MKKETGKEKLNLKLTVQLCEMKKFYCLAMKFWYHELYVLRIIKLTDLMESRIDTAKLDLPSNVDIS